MNGWACFICSVTWEDCSSLLTLTNKRVPRSAGGSSVWLGKLQAWKCECNKRMDCRPIHMKTELPCPYAYLERIVFEILSTIYSSYIAPGCIFTSRMIKFWLCKVTCFFIVHCLEGKYMESQCSLWNCKVSHSIQVPLTGAWMDITTWSLGY